MANATTNTEVIDMAKLNAAVTLMGVNQSTGGDGKVYSRAQLYFKADKTMLEVGVDKKQPELLTRIMPLEMVEGNAVIHVREWEGQRFLDLVGFDLVKK
jgi:hypothetical protein